MADPTPQAFKKTMSLSMYPLQHEMFGTSYLFAHSLDLLFLHCGDREAYVKMSNRAIEPPLMKDEITRPSSDG